MRLPTDPAKLKLLSREYILKHCRVLEKEADAFKKQNVYIPRKQLKEIWDEMPVPSLKVYHTHGDAQDFIHKTAFWIGKLKDLLFEESR